MILTLGVISQSQVNAQMANTWASRAVALNEGLRDIYETAPENWELNGGPAPNEPVYYSTNPDDWRQAYDSGVLYNTVDAIVAPGGAIYSGDPVREASQPGAQLHLVQSGPGAPTTPAPAYTPGAKLVSAGSQLKPPASPAAPTTPTSSAESGSSSSRPGASLIATAQQWASSQPWYVLAAIAAAAAYLLGGRR